MVLLSHVRQEPQLRGCLLAGGKVRYLGSAGSDDGTKWKNTVRQKNPSPGASLKRPPEGAAASFFDFAGKLDEMPAFLSLIRL